MAKRKISEKQRRIYRRRRIVASLLVLLFLLACAGIVWGFGAGIRVLRGSSDHPQAASTSKGYTEKKNRGKGREESDGNKSGSDKDHESGFKTLEVRNCGPLDVDLELRASDPTTTVGGSIVFTASITYKGAGSCLIDGSDGSRVLLIRSGQDNIWRSDSCPSDARSLLMATGDKDVQTITWNADASQDECQPDENLPRVNAGSYSAQLILKSNEKVKSQVVPIMIQ